MNTTFQTFARRVRHSWKFRFFLLVKLPSAFFSGVQVKKIDENQCEVSVPFKWFSQNPFRSTYFACLSMAAEMSTGALAMGHIYKKNPPVSMLVIKTVGDYFKKATGITTFTCTDGALIKQVIEESVLTGEARTLTAKSTGRNPAGEVVAEFQITWSFKVKKQPRKTDA